MAKDNYCTACGLPHVSDKEMDRMAFCDLCKWGEPCGACKIAANTNCFASRSFSKCEGKAS